MAGEATAAVRVPCPACGGRVKVPPGQAGQKCRCPKCNAEFLVPGLAGSTRPPDVPATVAVPKAAAAKPRPAEDRLTPLGIGEAPGVAPPPPSLPAERPVTMVPRPSEDDDQLADLSVTPPPPEPPAPVAAPPEEEFGFECTLCRTRLYAVPSVVGRYVRCPDCHTKVQVPPPKPRAKKADVLEDAGGEFRLSEPVERPPVPLFPGAATAAAGPPTAAAAPGTPPAAPPPPSPPRGDVLGEQARSLLAKAEAEVAEEEEDLPKLVFDRSLTTGLVSFLKDPQALGRWILLSLGGAAVVWLLNHAVAAAQGGAIAQFGALAMSMLLCLGGATWMMLVSVSGLAVLQDTSNGYDKIEQWPGLNVIEWMLEAFYVINCVLASFVPGFLLGRLLLPGIYGPLLGLATLAAAFPVFLLSALDAGSRIALYSATIWPSVRRAWPLWQMFYLLSAGLALGAVVAFQIMYSDSLILNLIGSAALMGVVLLYFRLLGKLAGALSLQIASQDESAPNESPEAGSPTHTSTD